MQLFGWAAADAILDLQRTPEQLAALLAALPAGWANAAWLHLGDSSAHPGGCVTEADALAVLHGSLGWQLGDTPITLPHFRVRHGMQLQLKQAGLQQERLLRFAAFEALADPSTPAAVDGSEVARLLPRLAWENRHKEVFLAPGALRPPLGFSHAQQQPKALSLRLPCLPPFPVAAAVRSTLAAQLGGQQPTRQQLWLMRHPAGVHVDVWDAVCLAALAAMAGGRRQLADARRPATPWEVGGHSLAVRAVEGRSPACSHCRRSAMLAAASSACTTSAACSRCCKRGLRSVSSPPSYRSYSSLRAAPAAALRCSLAARWRRLQSSAAARRQRLNQGHQARKAAGLAGAEAAAWATALLNARRRAGSDVKWRRTRRASARRCAAAGAGRRARVTALCQTQSSLACRQRRPPQWSSGAWRLHRCARGERHRRG